MYYGTSYDCRTQCGFLNEVSHTPFPFLFQEKKGPPSPADKGEAPLREDGLALLPGKIRDSKARPRSIWQRGETDRQSRLIPTLFSPDGRKGGAPLSSLIRMPSPYACTDAESPHFPPGSPTPKRAEPSSSPPRGEQKKSRAM